MERNEKIITGCCVATAVLSLFSWYSVSITGSGDIAEGMREMLGDAGSKSGLSSAPGVLAVVAALAAVGLIHAGRSDMLPWSRRSVLIAPFVACVVSCICILLFSTGGDDVAAGPFREAISAGRTFWYWLALIAMGAATWFAFQRWQQGVAAERSVQPSGAP